MRNNKNSKEAIVLLTVLLLMFSNFVAVADTNTTTDESTPNQKIIDLGLNGGFETIIDEEFGSTFPSEWTQNVTNPSCTWKIEENVNKCHSDPYFAICYNDLDEQDEWFITDSLNFSKYSVIKFSFFFMMDWFLGPCGDYCDLNVYIKEEGEDWELIWYDDYYKDPLKEFESWVWHDTFMGKHIDLSDYAGKNSVFIGFQYQSDDNTDGCQIYIDDILIYGNDPSPNPIICDAKGPYEGKAAETIYFYGDASGGSPPYTYRWDFGDGTRYIFGKNPTHKFYKVGTFNVSLRVTDTRLPKRRFDINYTTAKIGKPDPGPPNLRIENITGGFLLKAEIINDGMSNATDIKWQIHARGGPFKIFDKKENGTIDNLVPGGSEEIRLKFFVGFGIMHIKITAEATDVAATTRERDALKLGILLIIFPQLL